jgi:hypothetical protein
MGCVHITSVILNKDVINWARFKTGLKPIILVTWKGEIGRIAV